MYNVEILLPHDKRSRTNLLKGLLYVLPVIVIAELDRSAPLHHNIDRGGHRDIKMKSAESRKPYSIAGDGSVVHQVNW